MSENQILPWSLVHKRLPLIFPEGTPHRSNCVWEIAAKTVFVMLYVNAVEGENIWVRPDQVTRMTDEQATKTDAIDRDAWREKSMESSRGEITGRWYAANTRESIRDDTLRNGLIQNGAVVERPGLATTSPAGRYALHADFAALFFPSLQAEELEEAITRWQATYLTASARMRIAVMTRGAGISVDRVLVTFPNGETRRMSAGPSSELSKHVIEIFAPRFLAEPAVIFLSESRDKVVARDDALAKSIGLDILADRNLPDIILADLGPTQPELIFVEVVATDGPVSEARKKSLLELTGGAGFPDEHVRFVTAFYDRSSREFKKTVDSLAWGSLVWFASEPLNLVEFRDAQPS